ncbi:hypothetical protein PRIPAC_83384 [Pristionchus pacificus]|uniref:Acyltransferase n=1 Tax=Pristionchus pacificus TaxID=54126 RepID=A0A2A6CC89_PRIPA|nr:hypothetical protein PRIPAC_83384 [Pristionchus pacificus]|eukprot:PDM75822.1 Acyltransferase [Pristionchus pacificus]
MKKLILFLIIGAASAFDFSLQRRVLTRLAGIQEITEELKPLWHQHLKGKEILYSINDLYNGLRLERSLSSDCAEDLSLILNPGDALFNTTDFEAEVLLPMADSSGKVGPGIMRGHFEFKGLYPECVNVDFAVPGRERNLKGAYFQVDIDNQLRNNDFEGACNITKTSTAPPTPNPVCAFRKVNDRIPEINAGFYVTLVIIGFFLVAGIVSGLLDYIGSEKWKDQPFTKANPLDIAAREQTVMGQIVLNAIFAVDTFFFLSGLMLSFFWFKIFKSRPKQVNSVRGWIMYYIHRIWRLSPPLYIMVLFYTFVFKQMLLNTPYNFVEEVWWDKCSWTWWWEIFYIHNYADYANLCLGYSWYLDAEMQIYLFTPLLLLPMAFKPVLAIVLGSIVMIISTALNMGMVFYYDWPASYSSIGDARQGVSTYSMLMYESPIIRCQIYLIGMAVGWLLQTRKSLKIHWAANLCLWAIAFALTTVVVLGLYSEGDGTLLPVFWRAMYSSLSRIAWGVGLAWIVVACWYGHGGFINEIMSAKFWIPLGRLTYCGYLAQIPVIMLLASLHTSEVWFSGDIEMLVTRTFPAVICTFLVAVLYSALFEINFVKVIFLYFSIRLKLLFQIESILLK